MYYGRKKIIILTIIIVLLVIVLAIGGVLVFTKTDLFKSSKTLFWKYALNEEQEETPISMEQLINIEKMMQQNPYTVKGELKIGTSDENTNQLLEKFQINIDGKINEARKYSQTNIKANYDDIDLFNTNIINSNGIFAAKSEEIATTYIGVKNENLKVLAQKLGMEYTVPTGDNFNKVNLTELFKISESELSYIKSTYQEIILNNIPNSNYSKQTSSVIQKNGTSYKTTAYRLDLSASEMVNLIKNILTNLQTDSVTLNLLATKATLLSLNEEYTTVEGINNLISTQLNNITEDKFTDTSFVVYNYKGQTISMEIS